LNLLADGKPSQGAVLLFGKAAERHFPSADLTCLHFHGTQIQKPIPSQQVYRETVYDHQETHHKGINRLMNAKAS